MVRDSAGIAAWQSNPDYDYNRELVVTDFDFWQWVGSWLERLLAKFFGSEYAAKYTEVTFVVIGVLLLSLILWFIYKKRPELFMRVRSNGMPYAVHEDTIYGVDFETAIQAALSAEDYREAVRLLYLQTLKQLSDDEYIDWQLYKTPTEYTYEVKPEALRTPFRKLTNSFLRVRYGNFEATEQLFGEMRGLQALIRKGGAT